MFLFHFNKLQKGLQNVFTDQVHRNSYFSLFSPARDVIRMSNFYQCVFEVFVYLFKNVLPIIRVVSL